MTQQETTEFDTFIKWRDNQLSKFDIFKERAKKTKYINGLKRNSYNPIQPKVPQDHPVGNVFPEDKYLTENTYILKVKVLPIPTIEALDLMEYHMGVNWELNAWVSPMGDQLAEAGGPEFELEEMPLKLLPRSTYWVKGINPEGEQVVYLRRRNIGSEVGRTAIYVGGKTYNPTGLLSSLRIRRLKELGKSKCELEYHTFPIYVYGGLPQEEKGPILPDPPPLELFGIDQDNYTFYDIIGSYLPDFEDLQWQEVRSLIHSMSDEDQKACFTKLYNTITNFLSETFDVNWENKVSAEDFYIKGFSRNSKGQTKTEDDILTKTRLTLKGEDSSKKKARISSTVIECDSPSRKARVTISAGGQKHTLKTITKAYIQSQESLLLFADYESRLTIVGREERNEAREAAKVKRPVRRTYKREPGKPILKDIVKTLDSTEGPYSFPVKDLSRRSLRPLEYFTDSMGIVWEDTVQISLPESTEGHNYDGFSFGHKPKDNGRLNPYLGGVTGRLSGVGPSGENILLIHQFEESYMHFSSTLFIDGKEITVNDLLQVLDPVMYKAWSGLNRDGGYEIREELDWK